MARFSENQGFSPVIMGVAFALMVGVGVVMEMLLPAASSSAGQPSRLFTLLILPVLITAIVAALGAFFRLRTRIEGERLIFGFPLGLRRTIPLHEIRSAEPVTYRPIRDFGGWGLRFGRMGMMYNARGNRAVRLHLASGKVVFVGSQKPEELARAICSAH